MTSAFLSECNFEDPGSVVTSFITAMNSWEVAAWEAQRACRDSSDPASYQVTVLQEMNRIFCTYCTLRERKYGRQGSFQRPPEYDPITEHIASVSVNESQRRAYVTTERQATFAGGIYQYVLQKIGGQWLIDSLRYDVDGEWNSHIL
jgi:hypothetical protein